MVLGSRSGGVVSTPLLESQAARTDCRTNSGGCSGLTAFGLVLQLNTLSSIVELPVQHVETISGV